MIGSRRFLALLTVSLLSLFPISQGHAGLKPKAKVEIKIATIAPEGSTWMRIMDQLDTDIRAQTGGEVGLRFYPGGIQGDESVVLRKIRAGQLQGGGFTGTGLGEIASGLRVMEIPFVYQSVDEVHAVRDRLAPEFEKMLNDAGFQLLGWSDVGFVYLFSKSPIAGVDDLRRSKMWLWEGDPLAKTLLQTAGVSPIPLPITDVVTALQTGMVDAVYTSPLACISLQWYARVSSMTDFPVTHAMGAVVVSRQTWDTITPASQGVVRNLAGKYFAQLDVETAKEDQQSIQVMQQKGIKLVGLNDADRTQFEAIGRTVREKLVGVLYTQELLNETLQTLDGIRNASGSPGR
jgi:TRAP-type C4-dicarboxylate transport system substrate-binding protein